jgi:hypothetical protein
MTSHQAGQASMEAVLIMIIITSLAMKVSSIAKERGFVANIVEGPWSPIRGMIEDGVWEKHTVSKGLHPNNKIRHQSTQD